MKKSIHFLTALAVFLFFVHAVSAQSRSDSSYHSTSTKTTITKTESGGNSSYVGLSGGYIFKNNKMHDNSMWYLNDGKFLELNAGKRWNFFGWSAALGFLQIDRRDPSQLNTHLNNRLVYENGAGTKPDSITSGLDTKSISFGPETIKESASKPFRGAYFLTGPNIWIGNGRLKGNLALEGGVGFSQVGYYKVRGLAERAGTGKLKASSPTGSPANYDLSVRAVQYQQYGMSQKYYDKVSSNPFSNPLDEKQPYELTPMGRLSANIEYALSPRISLHAGANLWYIFSPKMKGAQTVSGGATYLNTKTNTVDYGQDFQYTQSFDQKNLMFAGANAGVKFWFGKSNQSKKVVKETRHVERNRSRENKQQEAKSVLVTVVDKLTKTPMGDVAVTLKGQDGQGDINAVTKENGTIKLNNVEAGNYEVNGEILGIATSSDHIRSSAFSGSSSTVNATLFYTDPRFILKGVAINTDDGDLVKGVKVNLNKEDEKIAHTTTNSDGNFQFLLQSNSTYQTQGLKNGLFSNTAQVSTKGLTRSQTLYVELELGLKTVEVGRSFEIENIQYNFDSATIRSDAARVLDRLVDFLRESADIKIELSSYTDQRGRDAYNLKLSQERAQSAVNYLISNGISRGRLVAKGYGENNPINSITDINNANTKEKEEKLYQENRRTEIKILKK
jgi:outer membrane protein OmpA-like peptidoglycan-associated protein